MPFPIEFRKVNTVSFGEKLKKWMHDRTPGGRMEKYKARYMDVLSEASGAERYLLMQRIDHDAKKHAWGTFTRDVVIAAATIGTVVYGGKVFFDNDRDLGKTLGVIKGKAKFVGQYPKQKWDSFVKDTADKFGEGLTQRVTKEMPNIMKSASDGAANLGTVLAESAVSGVQGKLDHTVDEALARFQKGLYFKAADVLEWIAKLGKK